MNKIYCYVTLLIFSVFMYDALKGYNYFFSFFIFIFMLFVSSKVYKFQKGQKLKDSYKAIPILMFLSFLFNDKHIASSQNQASLNVLLASSVFGISMITSFLLFGETVRHFLLLLGCIAFSTLFSFLFTKKYIL
ncbi:hypothetical protein [Pseudoalteromonas sp. MTN2-4]|uniref:hypothetical protein n=1 Tax=Pseudoalteromonas sp. MTN2-4 TaxID=3056555 RepID=UPI0036F3DC40